MLPRQAGGLSENCSPNLTIKIILSPSRVYGGILGCRRRIGLTKTYKQQHHGPHMHSHLFDAVHGLGMCPPGESQVRALGPSPTGPLHPRSTIYCRIPHLGILGRRGQVVRMKNHAYIHLLFRICQSVKKIGSMSLSPLTSYCRMTLWSIDAAIMVAQSLSLFIQVKQSS